MRFLYILGLLILHLVPTGKVWAVSAMQPAATVNNEVITVYDLQQRIDLTLLQTQTPRTAEARKNIARTVLETQILEFLRIEEATRLGMSASASDVQRAIAHFEEQNGFAEGGIRQILREQNIDYQAFKQTFRANIAWGRVVQEDLMRNIDVTDAEIARAVERERAALLASNASEARLMMLTLSHQAQTPAQAHESALSLRQNILSGARFSELARQFSADISAQFGGDLGWVLTQNLTPETQLWLAQAQKNAVSPPINIGDGTALFQLRDRREASARTIDEDAIESRIGNIKMQSKIRALERLLRREAIIKIFVAL